MKSRNTRKVNRKNRLLKGGQSSPTSLDFSSIESKLTDFQQEASTLASWAEQYNLATTTLNNTELMDNHRRLANSLAGQANIMYNRAQVLWRTVYGSPWVPPPSPAPATI